jgi:hypothetical protein
MPKENVDTHYFYTFLSLCGRSGGKMWTPTKDEKNSGCPRFVRDAKNSGGPRFAILGPKRFWISPDR